MVKSIGPVPLCDGDGFTIEPERYREGWVLTDAGKDALRKYDPDAYERYLSNDWNDTFFKTRFEKSLSIPLFGFFSFLSFVTHYESVLSGQYFQELPGL